MFGSTCFRFNGTGKEVSSFAFWKYLLQTIDIICDALRDLAPLVEI